MYKASTTLTLVLITLVACTAPKTNTQILITEIPTLLPSSTHPVVEMSSIGDGGLISGQPCALPCFFGIRIGETLLDQVIPVLESKGVAPCHQIDEMNIFCSASDIANISVSVDKTTRRVNGIGYDPSIQVTVDDIIGKYGDPDLIYIELGGIPESTTTSMLLVWSSIELEIDLGTIPDIGNHNFIVENTTEVRWVTYSAVNYTESSQPWKGYGTYQPDEDH